MKNGGNVYYEKSAYLYVSELKQLFSVKMTLYILEYCYMIFEAKSKKFPHTYNVISDGRLQLPIFQISFFTRCKSVRDTRLYL